MPVAVFSLANNDWIDPSAILQERYVICGAYKWQGQTKVHTVSVLDDSKRYAKNPHDDRYVIEHLHKVLSEADVVVGHNSESFDNKYVATRALVHGLSPLPPLNSIDTYKVAKGKFNLNSNKLDYIGKLLGVGQKIKTSPGLWLRVLSGEKQAVKDMVKYNKQDVILLEKVFDKLMPYVQNFPSLELFGSSGCPRCGSDHVQSRGVHRAISRIYQRLQCQECGGWFRKFISEGKDKTKYRIL